MKKLLYVILALLLFGCGNPAKELTNTEKDVVLEKTTSTTNHFYSLLKEASYEKTIDLVAKDDFQGYSDQAWLDFLKGQDATYGKVIDKELIGSEASSYEDGTIQASLIFRTKRANETIHERINVVQSEGKGEYKIKGYFFSQDEEGIYNTGN